MFSMSARNPALQEALHDGLLPAVASSWLKSRLAQTSAAAETG